MARCFELVGGALLLAAVPASLAAMPVAQAQTQTNGRNLSAVMVDAGPNVEYIRQGGGQWIETDSQGRTKFRFRERARDEWSVYLVDDSRGIELQLDIHRRKVTYSERGGPRRDLYNIIRFTHNGANYPPEDARGGGGYDRDDRDGGYGRDDRDGGYGRRGGGGTRDVEVGPIWNQRDAENKCRAKADELRGEWTGQWRTTVQGRMSVCEIRTGGGWGSGGRRGPREVLRDIEVGPIWSQRDAETKCRAEARRLGAEWTGQWRTTIQGRMSVCQFRFR